MGGRSRLQHQPDKLVERTRPASIRSRRRRSPAASACRRPPIPRSRTRPIACCAACPATIAGCRPRPIGGARSSTPMARSSRPSSSCAATWRRCASIGEPGVANYINVGDNTVGRVMPTVGLEYRYPLIGVQSWGTQTLEPIAQLIFRPDETGIGLLPNEDAQSLIFDDSNLFKVNKFSGWDRVEGGSRANVGFQYTAQFNRGGNINVLFGQSYQMFGQNSFAIGGTHQYRPRAPASTPRSRTTWRGSSYQPNSTFTVHVAVSLQRGRFHAAAQRSGSRRQFRPLEHVRDVRQLCRPAAARVPAAPRGRPRQRTAEAQPELGLVRSGTL